MLQILATSGLGNGLLNLALVLTIAGLIGYLFPRMERRK